MLQGVSWYTFFCMLSFLLRVHHGTLPAKTSYTSSNSNRAAAGMAAQPSTAVRRQGLVSALTDVKHQWCQRCYTKGPMPSNRPMTRVNSALLTTDSSALSKLIQHGVWPPQHESQFRRQEPRPCAPPGQVVLMTRTWEQRRYLQAAVRVEGCFGKQAFSLRVSELGVTVR